MPVPMKVYINQWIIFDYHTEHVNQTTGDFLASGLYIHKEGVPVKIFAWQVNGNTGTELIAYYAGFQFKELHTTIFTKHSLKLRCAALVKRVLEKTWPSPPINKKDYN